MTPKFRFSIIITSFNQREFIKDSVDSALSQRSLAAEIIVVDDGSTDGSQEILRQYGDAVRLVCLETNQGASEARNRGASLASGDYLLFHDGDDVLMPSTLEVFERVIQAKKPKLILGDVWWFKGQLPVLPPGGSPHDVRILEYQDYLRRDRPFTRYQTIVVDHQSFEDAGGWATDFQVNYDMDFMLRAGTSGRTILVLDPLTKFYRIHAVNDRKHRCMSLYITALYKMMVNERSGKYPGGKCRSFERQAFIGGQVFRIAKGATKAGLYGAALKLLARGWFLACAAVTRQLAVRLRRRQEPETLQMPMGWSSDGPHP